MDLITTMLLISIIGFILLLAMACLAAWIFVLYHNARVACELLSERNADLEQRLLAYEEVG